MVLLLSPSADRGAVAWLGDRLVCGFGSFEPEIDGGFQFGQCLSRRVTVSRAKPQVGNVSDPAPVVGVPKDVDVIAGCVSHERKLGVFAEPEQAELAPVWSEAG